MNEHDLKIIQSAIGYAEDVIRFVANDNGIQPHELEGRGYQTISDAFYAMNSCWLDIQSKFNGGDK